ncbi:MAG: hypothetical protein CR988_05560 [Treponema sp.]|nr:MAG: hypothetical protein CR988_05560 [Treponema sp.]
MPTEIDTNYISGIANTHSMAVKQKKRQEKKKQGKVSRFAQMVKEGILFSKESEILETNDMTDEELLVHLQDMVHSTGDTLKKRVSPESILEYKTAVRNFVNYVVNNAYDFQKANTRRMSFSKPQSSPIRVIDQKLERFASQLLLNQLSQLQILERLEEIKGLLVDLLR